MPAGTRRVVRSDLAAAFRDRAESTPSAADVDWYAAQVPRGCGPVLNALCGTGRLMLALLQRDCPVHGVEEDPALFAVCARRLQDAGRSVPLFRQDLQALNLPFRYGMAFVAGGAFQQLIDPVAIALALARLRAHLVEPRQVVIELAIPAHAAHPPGAPLVEIERVICDDGSSITLRSEIRIDVEAARMERRERYERRAGSGRGLAGREDQRLMRTWYRQDEALALLRDAGFTNARIEPLESVDDPEAAARRFAVIATA
ncbi:MAG: class I SAM-dependent methyltransferase [Casimicrobiaceae bacterium]